MKHFFFRNSNPGKSNVDPPNKKSTSSFHFLQRYYTFRVTTRILQSDWSKTFWLITPEQELCKTWAGGNTENFFGWQ